MNIEQIAQEVRLSMMRDFNGLSKDIDIDVKDETEFLRRCLSKLAEQDMEPVAEVDQIDTDEDWHQYAWVSVNSEIKLGQKLYTEAQLLAAQQRTAEACARYCAQTLSPSKPIPNDAGRAWIAGTPHCTDGIRNGEWRKY